MGESIHFLKTAVRGLLLAISASLALAACGGGGGGGGGGSSPEYTIGGTVNGLSGTIILQSDDGELLALTSDGTFSFLNSVVSGAAYSVSIYQRPMLQSCGISNSSGSVSGADITDIAISCNDLNVVFVTSVTGKGDLGTWQDAIDAGESAGGLAAGDAICQARAQAAGLPGTFVAWISTSTDDAYCRVHGLSGLKSSNCGEVSLPTDAGPWVRTDGHPFSNTIDELTGSGAVFVPASYDEYGNDVSGSSALRYFTNTLTGGTNNNGSSSPSCSDWTASTGGLSGLISVGDVHGTVYYWTEYSSDCATTSRLLCFQSGAGNPLPSYKVDGKTGFMTSLKGKGNLGGWADAVSAGETAGGLPAGDAICQARALAGGLANPASYKAWLSDNATDASTRFLSAGPWARPDGVLIANSIADLTDGSLFSTISQDESGSYISVDWVGTGTLSNGTSSTYNCDGWTDDTNSFTTTAGQSSLTNSIWTEGTVNNWLCGTPFRLYCLED